MSDSGSIVPALTSNAYSQAWETNLGSSRLLLTKRATKEFRGSNPACKSYDMIVQCRDIVESYVHQARMSLQTHGKSGADAEHDIGEEYGETVLLRAELRLGKRTCVKHNDTV